MMSTSHCSKGISNPAALCYMISVLHQWYMMPNLREHILSLERADFAQCALIFEIIELWNALYDDGREVAVDCVPLWEEMYGQVHGEDIFLQKDASEFSSDCLNKLFNEFETEPSAGSIVKDFLAGDLVNTLSVHGISTGTRVLDRTERFLTVSVPVHIQDESINLERALYEFVKEEQIPYRWPDNSNPSGDRIVLPTTKSTKFHSLPKYLTFHLKRFKFDLQAMRKVKLHGRFEFPRILDMGPYMTITVATVGGAAHSAPSVLYRLSGVVIHRGRSANSGHYYSLVRNRAYMSKSAEADAHATAAAAAAAVEEGQVLEDEEQWLLFNDHTVTPFDLRDLEAEAFGGDHSHGSSHSGSSGRSSCSSSGSSSRSSRDVGNTTNNVEGTAVVEMEDGESVSSSHHIAPNTTSNDDSSATAVSMRYDVGHSESGVEADGSDDEPGSDYNSESCSMDSDCEDDNSAPRSAFMLYYDRIEN